MSKKFQYLIVGLGCFFGAILRYLFENIWNPLSNMPLGTLAANILGTIIIGLVTGIFFKNKILKPWTKTMITTGFCGGLTTFSSFSLDVVNLIQQAHFYEAAVYASLTMFSGLFGVFLGLYLTLGKNLILYFNQENN